MTTARERRSQRLKLLDDDIGRALRASEASGELQAAPSYGKPLDFGDGYAETPAEPRMGYKILKDAGVVPPEVELMRQIEQQQQTLDAAPEAADAATRRQRITEMRTALALRLEKLRTSGTL